MSGCRSFKADILLPLVVGLGLLVAAAIIKTNIYAEANDLPLIGSMTHNFGIIKLDNELSPLQHTFTLKNQSDGSIDIKKVSSTCGCTEASTDVDHVPPGGIVRVSAILTMSESGFKQAEVNIVTDRQEQNVVTLVLQATGRRRVELMVIERQLQIQQGENAYITIFAIDYDSDSKPNPPVLSASEGLTSTFDSWKLVHQRYEASSQPARWQGRIEVTSRSSLVLGKSRGRITIESTEGSAISIPIDIYNDSDSNSRQT